MEMGMSGDGHPPRGGWQGGEMLQGSPKGGGECGGPGGGTWRGMEGRGEGGVPKEGLGVPGGA